MAELSIGLIQLDIEWEDPQRNQQKIRNILLAQKSLPELVVLPEMFMTGFSCDTFDNVDIEGRNAKAWMQALSQEFGSAFIGSVKIQNEQGHYKNRLIMTGPGSDAQTYDKRHLFSLSSEARNFSRGNEQKIFTLKSWSILPQICYDLRFPVWARNVSSYDLMINVANWPAVRRHAWRSLLVARAIENQAFVVGVNRVGRDGNGLEYSGDSLVVDPLGNILLDAGESQDLLAMNLSKKDLLNIRSAMPFLKDMDQFALQVEPS